MGAKLDAFRKMYDSTIVVHEKEDSELTEVVKSKIAKYEARIKDLKSMLKEASSNTKVVLIKGKVMKFGLYNTPPKGLFNKTTGRVKALSRAHDNKDLVLDNQDIVDFLGFNPLKDESES